MAAPEELARKLIDAQLEAAGWVVQDRAAMNRRASLGVAVREYPMASGPCDYLLFVDGKACGVIEAKPEGTTLSGVAEQSAVYQEAIPEPLATWGSPLRFGYESSGSEVQFADRLDPDFRSRRLFAFHRPETLLEWLKAGSSLRLRFQQFPALDPQGLRECQVEAIEGIEHSLAQDQPRTLIQMATGAGKTFTAANLSYRLLAHAEANPDFPPETFDIVIVDECHRSIYGSWRQVLDYFDAHVIGLTATPSVHTMGFFNSNLVAEYPYERSVVDGVNVPFEIFRIRTQIGEHGSRIPAGFTVPRRDRHTRRERYEQLDDDLVYSGADLDRSVIAPNQIRTVLETFRDTISTELFPGRTEVPKTLIFAKDDHHAETIVEIAREVFGKGNEFAKKITYRVTGVDPEQLISAFRNDYNPRIGLSDAELQRLRARFLTRAR